MRIGAFDSDSRRRAREPLQPSTFHQFAQSSSDETAGGRFGKQEGSTPTVVGSEPIVRYPELPADSPFHHDPVPDEPPLGININEMVPLEPSSMSHSARAPGGAEAPLGPRQDVEHAAPPSSSATSAVGDSAPTGCLPEPQLGSAFVHGAVESSPPSSDDDGGFDDAA